MKSDSTLATAAKVAALVAVTPFCLMIPFGPFLLLSLVTPSKPGK